MKVQQILIKKSNPNFKTLDNLCFKSKNLYNYALYLCKNHLTETGHRLGYNDLYHKIKHHESYRAMTSVAAQQCLMNLDFNFKAYFAAIKSWKKDKSKFTGCPKLPKFKHKTLGRNVVTYTYQGFRPKRNFIHFAKRDNIVPIQFNIDLSNKTLKQVRIVPKSKELYVVEIVYEETLNISKVNYNIICGLDLGVSNLATLCTSLGDALILSGGPLKSINQYYFKKQAELKSQLEKVNKKRTSKKIRSLNLKRNSKCKDFLHQSTRSLVKELQVKTVSKLVIGECVDWKREVNLGDKNNQHFCSISHDKFVQMLTYKCADVGIEVVRNNEFYTSKASSLDLDKLSKQEQYSGKRTCRGLYKTSNNLLINADVNGALNILRKEIGDAFVKETIDRGRVVRLVRVKLNPQKKSL